MKVRLPRNGEQPDDDKDYKQYIKLAMKAREKAYAPYSNFKVGCVLIDKHNHLHEGCNVENAAFGPTNCAERTALFRAIADGHEPQSFKAIVVVGDTYKPITPCGVCRQVMSELCAPNMPVIMSNLRGQFEVTTVAELLPGAFGLK